MKAIIGVTDKQHVDLFAQLHVRLTFVFQGKFQLVCKTVSSCRFFLDIAHFTLVLEFMSEIFSVCDFRNKHIVSVIDAILS